MYNLLQPTQGGSVEKVLGLFVCLILIGIILFLNYKKGSRIINSRYSNGLVIGYAVTSIILSVFAILGSNIMLTSEPNIGLIVVAVFMVIFPTFGSVYLAFVPVLAVIKTLLKQARLNLAGIVFACIATLCSITSVIMFFIVIL